MARKVHRLRANKINKYPPGSHFDGYGLELRVQPSGSRSFVQRMTIRGKRKRIAMGLGAPSVVTLAEARSKSIDNLRKAYRGEDPRSAKTPPFREMASEWLRQKMIQNPTWFEKRAWTIRMEKYIDPQIANCPIDKVSAADITAIRDKCPSISTSKACVRHIREVLERAIAEGRRAADDNPANAIQKNIKKPPAKNFGWVPAPELKASLETIATSDLPDTMKRLMMFIAFVPLRVNEIREMKWEEADGQILKSDGQIWTTIWTIPAERMKGRKDFRLRLPRTAHTLLGTPKAQGYVWDMGSGKPPHTEVLRLARIKLNLRYTYHGCRHTYETWAVQNGHSKEMVQRSTGHKIKDGTQAETYQHHEYLDECALILAEWNAYLMAGMTPIRGIEFEDIPADYLPVER